MISIPIQGWLWGPAAVLRGMAIGVVLQMLAVVTLLEQVWPVRRTLFHVASVVLFAWAVEYLGSSTGIPFGRYSYTDQLQPQLFGVPLLIPCAWLMMMPPSWAAAYSIVQKRNAVFVLVSALAFTAWDLFLDPQMVHWGLWTWDQPSGYFGIPWTNFAGWLLAAAILTTALRPGPVYSIGLVLVYSITWLLESIALIVFWSLPGPGVAGMIVMGLFVVIAWLRGHRTCSQVC